MIERYHVAGMACRNCAAAITGALLRIEDVDHVDVDLDTGSVDVESNRPTNADEVERAVAAAGYELTSTDRDRGTR